jgi:NAD(P)-dependent dehydrogenase (short-subunit alcohol dehydrogenase family)
MNDSPTGATLEDKVAIVTGAAQGIGLAYAHRLAREGASVVVADVQAEAAEQAAAEIVDAGGEAVAVAVDVSRQEQTEAMAQQAIEAFGGIDILVNNAAIYAGYIHYGLMDLPLDYWQKFLDVNLTGVLLCCQAAVPSMRERGGGKIVNQSSAGGRRAGNQYGLTKLGVQGLTVSLARSLGKHRINVNCIAPGIIDTEATRGHYTQEQLDQMVARHHPIGRIGTVEDMANALAFLVSPESDFVTGQIVHVDGGFVMDPS